MSLFGISQEWVRRFLALQEPQLPNFLRVAEGVAPTLDVAQNGWADFARPGQVAHSSFTVAALSAAGEVQLTGVLTFGDAMLFLASLEHAGGAAALNCEIVLRFKTNAGSEITLWKGDVPVGETIPWSTLGGGAHFWYVPQDWQIVLIHPATGAGETLRVDRMRLTSRAGARLL